jgi:hypothetical protein
MARPTILELQQLLALRNAECQTLRERCGELEGNIAVLKAQLGAAPSRTSSAVHLFDPGLPGSYAAACKAAREQGGVVRRAAQTPAPEQAQQGAWQGHHEAQRHA